MSKNIRLLIAVAALVMIAVLAGNQTAWSKVGQNAVVSQPDTKIEAALSTTQSFVGTVESPPNDVHVTGTTSVNVGGVAVVTGGSFNSEFKAGTGPRQGDFISKTITIYLTSGSAMICFAAQNNGFIYFQAIDGTTWAALPTILKDGEACAVVSTSGNYAFGK